MKRIKGWEECVTGASITVPLGSVARLLSECQIWNTYNHYSRSLILLNEHIHTIENAVRIVCVIFIFDNYLVIELGKRQMDDAIKTNKKIKISTNFMRHIPFCWLQFIDLILVVVPECLGMLNLSAIERAYNRLFDWTRPHKSSPQFHSNELVLVVNELLHCFRIRNLIRIQWRFHLSSLVFLYANGHGQQLCNPIANCKYFCCDKHKTFDIDNS